MKRLSAILAAGALFLFGAADARADIFTVMVKSLPNVFSPAEMTIFTGDGIVWVWLPGVTHSSTSDTGLWDSGLHANPFRFRRIFLTAGDFPYFCMIHGAPGGIGMSGIIHVLPHPGEWRFEEEPF